jgi:hypothetical protein
MRTTKENENDPVGSPTEFAEYTETCPRLREGWSGYTTKNTKYTKRRSCLPSGITDHGLLLTGHSAKPEGRKKRKNRVRPAAVPWAAMAARSMGSQASERGLQAWPLRIPAAPIGATHAVASPGGPFSPLFGQTLSWLRDPAVPRTEPEPDCLAEGVFFQCAWQKNAGTKIPPA